jgi:20S proteasome alpha/beta subunit
MNQNVLYQPKKIKERRRKERMTLLVGIVCQDAIVMASDSQTTDEWGQKRTSQKISTVQFADGASGLIAQAGSADFASQTIEKIERSAAKSKLTDYRSIPELAAGALAEMRQEKAGKVGPKTKLNLIFEENKFCLLIANYYKGKPYLFRFDSDKLSATMIKVQFVSVGNSYATADYVLEKFDFSNMPVPKAVLAAAFTVGEVIQVDSTCGPPIQAGVVRTKGLRDLSHAHIYDPLWIKEAADQFDKGRHNFNNAVQSYLDDVLILTVQKMEKFESSKQSAGLPFYYPPPSGSH